MCEAVSLRIFESETTVSRSDAAVNFAGGAATRGAADVAGAAGATCATGACAGCATGAGAGACAGAGAATFGAEPFLSMKSKTSSRVIRLPGPVPTKALTSMPCSETRRRTTGESNLFETLAGIAVRVAVATLAAAGCITGAG